MIRWLILGVCRNHFFDTEPEPKPKIGEYKSWPPVCDHFHRGSVRYVMVNRSATAYTDTINCG